MKTKHIALSIMLNALILSTPCSGMDYIKTHMTNAQTLTSNFLKSCWNVGVLATLYAKVGIYDFKKISGLNENALDTYNKSQLETAQKRVEMMIKYNPLSQPALDTLNKFSTTIQGKIIQKEDIAQAAAEEAKMMEEADLSYDEAQTVEEIKKMMREQK